MDFDESVVYATACQYVDRGFSVIPIAYGGKRPLIPWAEFQQRRARRAEISAWFDRFDGAINLGLVTGAVSNLVIVDADNEAAAAWVDAHLLPTSWIVSTARGLHFGFSHPGVPVRNRAHVRTTAGPLSLDVRADGGFVVAPPSVHSTGVVYEQAGRWPAVAELPVFDPAWLQRDTTPRPASSPGVQPRSPLLGPPNAYMALRRARAWLSTRDPAIEGHGGDTCTFATACVLVRGFALSATDALVLLEGWNAQCSPPWTRRELETKVQAALTYGVEPFGGRL